MVSDVGKMANGKSGDTVSKIAPSEQLGKSTLIGNINVSIPMPQGATPPPIPAAQSRMCATPGAQGAKKAG
jgi:hypothetical protein